MFGIEFPVYGVLLTEGLRKSTCKIAFLVMSATGLRIDRIIVIGGIAKKSPYIMQIMSDVLGRPIMISKEDQVCAKGAAIYAAVAAGLFASIEEAQQIYCEPYEADYYPNPDKQQDYAMKYRQYMKLAQSIEEFHR